MAVKDSRAYDNGEWTDPINWRDRLPRDIAVQRRLHEQGGHENIHAFKGHRLSMPQQRYRVYNEICDKGTYARAFEYYSRQWEARREQYESGDSSPTDNNIDPNNLPVIPESFLWQTFLNLVEACIFMRDGAGVKVNGKQWRSIVHRDLHVDNVFMKVSEDCNPQKIEANHQDLINFYDNFIEDEDRHTYQNEHCVTEFTADSLVSIPLEPYS